MREDAANKATGQGPGTADRNAKFFATDKHGRDAAELDTYRLIREALNREVACDGRMLDVGNGGVFEYDTSLVNEIVAVDLFLDQLDPAHFPPNVTPRAGNALDLEEYEAEYDAVLESLLFHHLVGERVGDLLTNVRRALAEAERVIKPRGRMLIVESCVPRWFYRVEKLLFRALVMLARTPVLGGHPATMQLPFDLLVELVGERFEVAHAYQIPPGRWTTQFGRKWPTAMTPARAYMIVASKRP